MAMIECENQFTAYNKSAANNWSPFGEPGASGPALEWNGCICQSSGLTCLSGPPSIGVVHVQHQPTYTIPMGTLPGMQGMDVFRMDPLPTGPT